VLKPGTYKVANEKGEVFTTLGTSSSYFTFTHMFPSFVHIFISKAMKKRYLLFVLLRIDPDPLAGSEASFLYHAIGVRPNPATGRAEPPSGARWAPPSPNNFSFLVAFFV
jgi:hypothetical protein